VGLAVATRYLAIGGYMFAITLLGYFGFREVLPFWMAAGCLGLLLGALWLRRA
jgi:uncharacterized membrane protein YjjB (DUF3815 family)